MKDVCAQLDKLQPSKADTKDPALCQACSQAMRSILFAAIDRCLAAGDTAYCYKHKRQCPLYDNYDATGPEAKDSARKIRMFIIGIPCQEVSSMGKRAGFIGTTSRVVLQFIVERRAACASCTPFLIRK